MNKIFCFLFAGALVVIAGCSRSGSYDDCVIDGVKGVTVPGGIVSVREACASKYPEEKKDIVHFSAELIANIKGRARIISGAANPTGEQLLIHLYHSNKEWVLTEVNVEVFPNGDELTHQDIASKRKLYKVPMKLKAYEEQTYMVDISGFDSQNSGWNLVDAKGYKSD